MRLHSPESAILSAVNALFTIIIPIMIHLAKELIINPIGASAILKEKLLYGLGGLLSFIRLNN
jgi:K+-transporting ATPase ATPase B chain